MASDDNAKCALCGQKNSNPLSVVREKGCHSIRLACKEIGQDVEILPGQSVHQECRRTLCHPNQRRTKTTIQAIASSPRTRISSNFDYKTKCIFCGTNALYNRGTRKRAHDVHPVMTLEFQKSIKLVCAQRNDEWANSVLGRIEYSNDLPAVEARYHQTCCSNFRSGYKIPKHFQTKECHDIADIDTCSEPKKGRPVNISIDKAFKNVLEHFEENETGQLTIADMVKRMEEICGEGYSNVYMKKRILEHYGGSVIITESNGKSNVVTFKSKGHEILYKFFKSTTKQDSKTERVSIIQTAGKLILNDITSMKTTKANYPSASSLMSVEDNMKQIPESLLILLRQLIDYKESETVVASLGQAIVQAAMPRKVIAPLQLGLGVQLHHHFGSKFLIDILNAMGFCSSYQEVQRFESSAATTIKSLVEKSDGQFVQFIGDNVDHNSATIDGHNTFHGMGIIATITPKEQKNHIIPRVHSTGEDLVHVGKINIQFYRQSESTENSMDAMLFGKFDSSKDTKAINPELDFLIKVSRPLRPNTPGWSGVMQAVNQGSYPGQAEIIFLPLIDLNSSDLSCIYSTLMFIAKESRKLQTTPVVTFDQPLYWKAVSMIENEPCTSYIKQTVVRLGAFHTEMSFLACFGHLMENSGLSELLSTVYATNTVVHMLNGKAVGRAVRGHFLLTDALDHILVAKTFPEIFENKEYSEDSQIRNVNLEHETAEVADGNHTGTECSHPMKALMDEVMSLTFDPKELKNSTQLLDMRQAYEETIKAVQESRTGKLWVQYMDMVSILKRFIAAERSGNWTAHLNALESMLPYFAAAGHNLYLKSSYVYLQQMHCLQQTHPDVYNAFLSGNHTVRRSDRFWGGLSTDLTIEQTLMRSLKSVGGMTRGRGMSEVQRAQWILSMPVCAEINSAMQEFTSKNFQTSDQHKESMNARIVRDNKDRSVFLEFLREKNPFDAGEGLMNIDSGVFADTNVNVDLAEEVGKIAISYMENKTVGQYKFKRKSQAVTMGTKAHIKIDGETCAVDPQLLFQRLIMISDNTLEDTEQLFQYELSTYPTALFDSSGLLRESQKSQLATSIWELGNCDAENIPPGCTVVLDGGSLLQRIPWNHGATFDSICESYCKFIKEKNYSDCHVVFDGYPDSPSTKDTVHERRTKGKNNIKISFSPNNPCKTKKDTFLANTQNKQNFLSLLGTHLTKLGCKVHNAEEDADLLIVITAVLESENNETLVIGEDTDLLVLLCYHANALFHRILFKSDSGSKKKKIWDIQATKNVLGENLCKLLPLIHAFSGCDTVSRIFGFGKSAILKKAKQDFDFRRHAEVFIKESSPDEVRQAGEELFTSLYCGRKFEKLNKLRYRHFLQKVSSRNTVVQVKSIPPTESAAKYHSFRAYSQVQLWIHGNTRPLDWGWCVKNDKMVPVISDLPPAPERLLKIIKCNCRVNCDSKRCSCRKHGLFCSVGCGECKGIGCSNVQLPDDDIGEL